MALQETPVYRALHRSQTVLGVERSPGICFFALVAGAEFGSFQGRQWPTMLVLLGVLVVGMGVLRQIAKADPRWFAMFGQRWTLRPAYRATSTPYRKDSKCPNARRIL